MKTIEIVLAPDGSARSIYDDEGIEVMEALGEVTIKRASNVEPDERGMWVADMSPVGGPRLTPHAKRSDALAEEVRWLRQHGTPSPL